LNTDDGEDILDPLVDLFLEQADRQLAAIQAAIREADATVLGNIAHTLKGASRSVGAALIGDLAEKLEQCGKAGSADEPQLAAQLAAALLETRSAFLAERSEYKRRRSNSLGGTSSPGADRVGEAA
jgi:HPt (histidine-containing phosphotransfer) domain-containing protein